MKTMIRKHSALFGVLATVLGLALLHIPFGHALYQIGLSRMLLGGVCLAVMVWLGGRSSVMFGTENFGKTLRGSLWALIIAVAMALFVLVALLGSQRVAQDWAVRLLSGAYGFLMVGFFEEALFRGLLTQGLVHSFGSTRRGLVLAVTAASLIFGFAHVATELITPQLSGMLLLTAALKTISTAELGLLLAALYLKYHNFFAIALVHGVNDFCLAMGTELGTETMTSSYVAIDGLDSAKTVILYTVFVVLYLPLVIRSYKILRALPLPQPTIYSQPAAKPAAN